MGLVFGKIDVELPAHQVVLEADGFQVWRYPPSVAAVVSAKRLNAENPPVGRDFTRLAFGTLARYIGVFGGAENAAAGQPEKVAMTGPVVMTPGETEKIAMTGPVMMTPGAPEKVAMTGPVVMTPGEPEKVAMTGPVVMAPGKSADPTMAFLLPAKYTSVAEAPVPTNPAVVLELRPARVVAVLSFSGVLPSEDIASAQGKADELLALMRKEGLEPTGSFSLAGYNPPFTLPWLRRNEVHIPVDPARFEE